MISTCPFCSGEARLVARAAIYVICTNCGARSRQITPRRIVSDATMRQKYGKYSEYEYKAELKLRERDIQAEHDRCVRLTVDAWERRDGQHADAKRTVPERMGTDRVCKEGIRRMEM